MRESPRYPSKPRQPSITSSNLDAMDGTQDACTPGKTWVLPGPAYPRSKARLPLTFFAHAEVSVIGKPVWRERLITLEIWIRFAKSTNQSILFSDGSQMEATKAAFYELRRQGLSVDRARLQLGLVRNEARQWDRDQGERLNKTAHLRKEDQQAIKHLLLVEGSTFRQIAKLVGCSLKSVKRVAKRLRETQLSRAGNVKFRQALLTRCPIHGPINVTPCVACAATRPRSRST